MTRLQFKCHTFLLSCIIKYHEGKKLVKLLINQCAFYLLLITFLYLPPQFEKLGQLKTGKVAEDSWTWTLGILSSLAHNLIKEENLEKSLHVKLKPALNSSDHRSLRQHYIKNRCDSIKDITTWAREHFGKPVSVNLSVHRCMHECSSTMKITCHINNIPLSLDLKSSKDQLRRNVGDWVVRAGGFLDCLHRSADKWRRDGKREMRTRCQKKGTVDGQRKARAHVRETKVRSRRCEEQTADGASGREGWRKTVAPRRSLAGRWPGTAEQGRRNAKDEDGSKRRCCRSTDQERDATSVWTAPF